MSIKAIALDLDDTLFLERDYVRSGFRAVAAHMRDFIREDVDWFALLWSDFESGIRGNAFDRALQQAGIQPEPDLIRSLIRVYREHRPDISLLPDVEPALDELAVPPDRMGVITDGPVVMQRRKFEALGLHDRVRHAIFTDAWGVAYRKPHERAFETFEWLARVLPEHCAYVSDNPLKDFRSPHERGWLTVRIIRSGGMHSHLPSSEGEVSAQIDTLADLPEVIRTACHGGCR